MEASYLDDAIQNFRLALVWLKNLKDLTEGYDKIYRDTEDIWRRLLSISMKLDKELAESRG